MHLPRRFDPYSKTGFATCRICKSSVHQAGSHYCQGCAYKKGNDDLMLWERTTIWLKVSVQYICSYTVCFDSMAEKASCRHHHCWHQSTLSLILTSGICAMCGKKVLDTKNYKQTSVWCSATRKKSQPSSLYFQYFIIMSCYIELEFTQLCVKVYFSLLFHST